MNINFKKYVPDIICIIFFAVISLVYFYPADLDGRRLEQHDNGAGAGLGVEIVDYANRHDGATTRWTNSVFGGMPTYQIAPSYDSSRLLSSVGKVYHLFLPDYVYYIFISMLGFYILLRAFDFKQWMAALGAIIWAFSSYFFIIIAAGHIWKVLTLAFIPPTIAGMVLCYKGKYLKGGIVTAIFAALQILSNHVQMTYYFLFPILFMFIGYLISAIREKQMMRFAKATGTLIVAAALAVCMNLSNLYHTYEYSKDSMRGKSELVKEGKEHDQTDSGLEKSYITQWSYGIGETWTLLIPNFKGGASVPLNQSKTAMDKATPMYEPIYGAFTQYWGEQPGTSGPVYVGAFVLTLFVLSLFIISNRNPLKWALLAATVLSILLAWGKNFMPFTDFFIDNIPMYNKFRTVSSILVIAEFTIPLLAMLALKEFVERVQNDEKRKEAMKYLRLSAIITGGIALIFAVAPSVFTGSCISSNDTRMMEQYVQAGYIPQNEMGNILASMSDMRLAMLQSDAWRSFIIIAIGTLILAFFYSRSKTLKPAYAVCTIIALCLIDMWSVNKRYLNDNMFVYPSGPVAVQKTEADEYILEKDKDKLDYRVLNYTVSTFNDNTTSFYHKSIGGYHAAKLRRYQELIEEHIGKEMQNVYTAMSMAGMDTVKMMSDPTIKYPIFRFEEVNCDSLFPVINMLNTRWFIMGGGKDGNTKLAVFNPCANGNAWFVNNVNYVNNANEEIDALHNINPKHTAVVDKTFSSALNNVKDCPSDSNSTVKLTSYDADALKYEVNSKNGGVVVFSEIYYPGWKATIDGKDAEIGRANYVLRAMYVPAGKHTLEMTFYPTSVSTTETIAYIAMALLLIGVVAGFIKSARKKKETAE